MVIRLLTSQITLNFVFPDINEKYIVELNNGSLHHIQGYQLNKADATISINRETLNQIILKQKTVESTFIDNFDFWFNIVTPNQ